MVVWLRRVLIVGAIACLFSLAIACTPGGGGSSPGARPQTGGSPAPASQAPVDRYNY